MVCGADGVVWSGRDPGVVMQMRWVMIGVAEGVMRWLGEMLRRRRGMGAWPRRLVNLRYASATAPLSASVRVPFLFSPIAGSSLFGGPSVDCGLAPPLLTSRASASAAAARGAGVVDGAVDDDGVEWYDGIVLGSTTWTTSSHEMVESGVERALKEEKRRKTFGRRS